jgi:lysophospholipase L1-like esterase
MAYIPVAAPVYGSVAEIEQYATPQTSSRYAIIPGLGMFAWYPLDTTARNGTTVLGSGVIGRWKLSDTFGNGSVWKQASYVVADSNVTLSGTQTIDDASVTAGKVVLCTAQTAPAENGPWTCAASAWSRPSWFDAAADAQGGAVFPVVAGATYAGSLWMLTSPTSGTITPGTTALTFEQAGGGGTAEASTATPSTLALRAPVTAACAFGPLTADSVTGTTGDELTLADSGATVTVNNISASSQCALSGLRPCVQDLDLYTQGAGFYTPASPGAMVEVDGFDVEVSWLQAASPSTSQIEVLSCDNASGNADVAITYTSKVWTFKARAATSFQVLGNGTPTYDAEYGYPDVGDEASVRFWYWPSRGQAGARITVNGCHGIDRIVTPSGASIAATTALYIGSNRGSATNKVNGALRRFRAGHAAGTLATNSAEFVTMGDSIMSAHDHIGAPGAYVYDRSEIRSRLGILNIAHSGDTIANQKTAFLANIRRNDPFVRGVYIQCGINDIINSGATGAQCLASLQDLIDTVRAYLPNALIAVGKITPCDAYSGMDATKRTHLATVQTGMTSLTDVDYLVTSTYATLGGGGLSLQAAYDSADHLHPNTEGSRVTGAGIREAFEALGLLPAAPTTSPWTPLAWRYQGLTGEYLPTKTVLSGSNVLTWRNSIDPALNFTSAGGTEPTYDATGGPDGGPCIAFARASGQFLTSAVAPNRYIAHDGGHMIVVFRAATINSSAVNVFDRDALIGATTFLEGIHLKAGTPAKACAYLYDVSASRSAEADVTAAAWHVVQWWLKNGTIYCQVDGGTPVSTACGVANALNGSLLIGKSNGSGSCFDGKIARIYTRSVPPTDDDLAAVYAWAQTLGVP